MTYTEIKSVNDQSKSFNKILEMFYQYNKHILDKELQNYPDKNDYEIFKQFREELTTEIINYGSTCRRAGVDMVKYIYNIEPVEMIEIELQDTTTN